LKHTEQTKKRNDMNVQSAKRAGKIASEIEELERKIRMIQKLQGSCGMTVTLSGTPRHSNTTIEQRVYVSGKMFQSLSQEAELHYRNQIESLTKELSEL
jgi:hypothetical protein